MPNQVSSTRARTQPIGELGDLLGSTDGPRRRNVLLGILSLTRAENCAIAAVACGIGGLLASNADKEVWRIVAASVAMALVVGFGNTVNDLFDEENDRTSKPDRALPSGIVSRQEAASAAVVLALMAVGVGSFVSVEALFTAIVLTAAAFLYSWKLKQIPLVGNLVVALEAAWLIPFGQRVVGSPNIRGLFASLIVGLGVLLIESAKTIEDSSTDAASGLRTIAHVLSLDGQRRLIAGVLVSLTIAWILPLALGEVHRPALYLFSVVASVPLWPPALRPSELERIGVYIRFSKVLWVFVMVGFVGLA